MSQNDFVDIACGNPGVGERIVCDAHQQAFHSFAVEAPEWRVGPSNDAGSHGTVSIATVF
jgi:hypothetical protein